MTDQEKIPEWVMVVETIALESLRAHLRTEMDLRAILRSGGNPVELFERAVRVLGECVEQAKMRVLMVRALLLLNKFHLSPPVALRVSEIVAGLHMLLLDRMVGAAYADHFQGELRRGEPEAVEKVRNVIGMLPHAVDLEFATANLFDDPRMGGDAAA